MGLFDTSISSTLGSTPSKYTPASLANAALGTASRLSSSIGGAQASQGLAELARNARTVEVIPPAVSPIITAGAARAACRAANVTSQARQDEVTAIAYKAVFDSIRTSADAGIGSINLILTVQQQKEIVPLLERNGYAVTVGVNSTEIKWADTFAV